MNKHLGLLSIMSYLFLNHLIDAGMVPSFQLPNQYQGVSNFQSNQQDYRMNGGLISEINSMRPDMKNYENIFRNNNGLNNYNAMNNNINSYNNGYGYDQNSKSTLFSDGNYKNNNYYRSQLPYDQTNQAQIQTPNNYVQPPTGILDWLTPQPNINTSNQDKQSLYRNKNQYSQKHKKSSGIFDFFGNIFGSKNNSYDQNSEYSCLNQYNRFQNSPHNQFNYPGNQNQAQFPGNESFNNQFPAQMRSSMSFNTSMGGAENERMEMMPTDQYGQSGTQNQACNYNLNQNDPNLQDNYPQMQSVALQMQSPYPPMLENNQNLNMNGTQELSNASQPDDPEWNKLKVEKVIIIKRVKVPIITKVPVPMPYPVPTLVNELINGANSSSTSTLATVPPGYLGQNTYMVDGTNNSEPIQMNNLFNSMSSPSLSDSNTPMQGFNPAINNNNNSNLPYQATNTEPLVNPSLMNPMMNNMSSPFTNPSINNPSLNPMMVNMSPLMNSNLSSMNPIMNPSMSNSPFNPMMNNMSLPSGNPFMANTNMSPFTNPSMSTNMSTFTNPSMSNSSFNPMMNNMSPPSGNTFMANMPPLTNPMMNNMSPLSNPSMNNSAFSPSMNNMSLLNNSFMPNMSSMMNMPNNYMTHSQMNPMIAQTMLQPGLQVSPYPNSDDPSEMWNDSYYKNSNSYGKTNSSMQDQNDRINGNTDNLNNDRGALAPKQFSQQQIRRAMPNATQLQTISSEQIPFSRQQKRLRKFL